MVGDSGRTGNSIILVACGRVSLVTVSADDSVWPATVFAGDTVWLVTVSSGESVGWRLCDSVLLRTVFDGDSIWLATAVCWSQCLAGDCVCW